MKDIINNMQKGLSEYSPGANTAVESANKALMAIGVLIILILFFLEMASWYKFIRFQSTLPRRERQRKVAPFMAKID